MALLRRRQRHKLPTSSTDARRFLWQTLEYFGRPAVCQHKIALPASLTGASSLGQPTATFIGSDRLPPPKCAGLNTTQSRLTDGLAAACAWHPSVGHIGMPAASPTTIVARPLDKSRCHRAIGMLPVRQVET